MGIEHHALVAISVFDWEDDTSAAVAGRLFHRTVVDLSNDVLHLLDLLLSGMLGTRNQLTFLRQQEIV